MTEREGHLQAVKFGACLYGRFKHTSCPGQMPGMGKYSILLCPCSCHNSPEEAE